MSSPVGGIPTGTHTSFLKKYPKTFLGSDVVAYLTSKCNLSKVAALDMGQKLLDQGLIECPVAPTTKFSDTGTLFRFSAESSDDVAAAEKMGKAFLHVVLPDGAEKKLNIELTSTARVCSQQVAASLDIVTGVKEWALIGRSGWLNMDLPVSDQWNKNDGPLKFRKKYFLTDSELPRVCRERLLVYHQAVQMVSSGVYVCTSAQYAKLGALAAQISFGDRDVQKHVPGKLQLRDFVPESSFSIESQLLESWSELVGMSRDDAVYEYTRLVVADVPTYGVARFQVVEKDKKQRDLGITPSFVFRIAADNSVVEQIRLDDLRTWNFSPKSIELDFAPTAREEKYVAQTSHGRDILALLSEYQYFKRSRGGVSDSLKIHFQNQRQEAVVTRTCQVDISKTVRELVAHVLKEEFGMPNANASLYLLRTATRWLSSDEKLGGLRETELFLEPRTDLHQIAEDGDLARAKLLLGSCPINAVDIKGDTALHLAVRKGQKLLVLMMLGVNDCDPNVRNAAGEPAVGESLDLSNCGMVRVPIALHKCQFLSRLDLSGNALITIPLEFAKMKLTEINLTGNPLPGLPMNVVKGGFQALAAFLSQVNAEAPWKTGKIVICGPKSGKSALANALFSGSLSKGGSVRTASVQLQGFDACVLDVSSDFSSSAAFSWLCSRRSVFCIVQQITGSTRVVLDQIAEINSAYSGAKLQGGPPLMIVLTHADKVSAAERKSLLSSWATALEPFASQIVKVDKEVGLVCDARDIPAATVAAFKTQLVASLEVAVQKIANVPQAFRSLHSLLKAVVNREVESPFRRVGGRVVYNPVYDAVAERNQVKVRSLPWVISHQEFSIYAQDAFLNASSLSAASKFLSEIGFVICCGDHIILDPVMFLECVSDLLLLRNLSFDGLVPFFCLQSLWPDFKNSMLSQLVSLLEAASFLTIFQNDDLVFIPSLLSARTSSLSWPLAVYAPKYACEWRLAEHVVSERLRCVLLSELAKCTPVRSVWSRGIVMTLDEVVARVEVMPEPPKKVVLSILSKSTMSSVEIGRVLDVVAGAVIRVLDSPEFANLKKDRLVRALSLQKPSLIRYDEIVEYKNKGKSSVAVQGVAVQLESLCPLSDGAGSFNQQSAPSSWKTLSTSPFLSTCCVYYVRLQSHVREMLRQQGGCAWVEDSAWMKTLEDVAACPMISESCRSILFSSSQTIIKSTVVDESLWSCLSRASEVVSCILAAEVGVKLDGPSRSMLRAVGKKFCAQVSALVLALDDCPVNEAKAAKKVVEDALLAFKAVAEVCDTVEGAWIVEKSCSSLCDTALQVSSQLSSEGKISSCISGMKVSLEQLNHLCRALDGVGSVRAAISPLHQLEVASSQIGISQSSFASSLESYDEVHRSLQRLSSANADVKTISQVVMSDALQKPSMPLFNRVLGVKSSANLLQQKRVASLMEAGGGKVAAGVGLGKSAIASLWSLMSALWETNSVSPNILGVCMSVDSEMVSLLDLMSKAELKSCAGLFLARKQEWANLVDVAKSTLLAGNSSSSRSPSVSLTISTAINALDKLWSTLEDSGKSLEAFESSEGALKSLYLDLQVFEGGSGSFGKAEVTSWKSIAPALLDAVESAHEKLPSVVQQLVQFVSSCANVAREGKVLVSRSLDVVRSARELFKLRFVVGLASGAAEVRRCVDQGSGLVQAINVMMVGHQQALATLGPLVTAKQQKSSGRLDEYRTQGVVASIVSTLRKLFKMVKQSVASGEVPPSPAFEETIKKILQGFDVLESSNLASQVSSAASKFRASVGQFSSSNGNAEATRHFLGAIKSSLDYLQGAENFSKCEDKIRHAWGVTAVIDEDLTSPRTTKLDPLQQTMEFARILEAAVAELTWAATFAPGMVAEKLCVVVDMSSQIVDALRAVVGPIRRCYTPYAAVHSTSSGHCKILNNFASNGDRLLALADAVSLLCEGLETSGEEMQGVGQKGMMAVREALTTYAEGEKTQENFVQACVALSSALDKVPSVRTDFVRVVQLVDMGHYLHAVVLSARAVASSVDDLLLQQNFSRSRNQLVTLLQEILQDLRRSNPEQQQSAPPQQHVLGSSSEGRGQSSPEKLEVVTGKISPEMSRFSEGFVPMDDVDSSRDSAVLSSVEESSSALTESASKVVADEVMELVNNAPVVKVRGIFKYVARNGTELSFQRGDVIVLEEGTDISVQGTWKGRIEGTSTPFLSFPSKYVKPI